MINGGVLAPCFLYSKPLDLFELFLKNMALSLTNHHFLFIEHSLLRP